MKKDIEWLKGKVWEQDTAIAKDYIYIRDLIHLINQLDEPEVLSQEWIDENKVARINDLRKMTKDDVVLADKLQNLLVPKQEPPVIPKYVADFIRVRKYTDAYSLQYIFCIAMERSEAEQLKKEYDWISANDETFARAWLDGYEVEEEPLYYALVKGHELITDEGVLTCKYWNLNTSNGDVFPSNRLSEDGKFLIEMSKSEWNKLGINESNADFVKVEE